MKATTLRIEATHLNESNNSHLINRSEKSGESYSLFCYETGKMINGEVGIEYIVLHNANKKIKSLDCCQVFLNSFNESGELLIASNSNTKAVKSMLKSESFRTLTKEELERISYLLNGNIVLTFSFVILMDAETGKFSIAGSGSMEEKEKTVEEKITPTENQEVGKVYSQVATQSTKVKDIKERIATQIEHAKEIIAKEDEEAKFTEQPKVKKSKADYVTVCDVLLTKLENSTLIDIIRENTQPIFSHVITNGSLSISGAISMLNRKGFITCGTCKLSEKSAKMRTIELTELGLKAKEILKNKN